MMRKFVLPIAATALVIGGCTAEHDVAQNAAPRADRASNAPLSYAKVQNPRVSSIAQLPDRGQLLRYRTDVGVVRRNAETFRPVELSEAHALNAARPGSFIELPTPSGQSMKIGFVRVEEGLDGNWSWVGRTAAGFDAVITFGQKAVFGRIAQPGTAALSLTTLAGQTWLVETDPSRVVDGNQLRNANRSDMVIPSKTTAAILARKSATASAKTAYTAAAAAVGPSQTVDVVLGYTNGLVTKYGGDSQANTRLTNLIAITNQAYVNSQVSGRVRLVKTVAVNYTDSNSNDTALDEVTGKSCNPTCADVTVPAALVPLRTARETYGGDLVSLVRPFQAPQQGSCGVGWLIGANGTPINVEDPYGYSVVSDGGDIDETDGRQYTCDDVTLAHEMGHNMGQQHNTEDAHETPSNPSSPLLQGAHSYSYGYRESTTTGFYTVMAYRLPNSTQFSINYFANPSVQYTDTGRATGTATNDNARSMNITMPLVAQFRNAVVPFAGRARTDINGDGRSDIVWRNANAGLMDQWWLNGSSIIGTGARAVAPIYRVVGTGDFNGDGRGDILWTNDTNDILWIWQSRGDGNFDVLTVGGYPPSWSVTGIADIDGDGRSDIIWRNSSLGLMDVWKMNGGVPTPVGARSVGSIYRVVGTGDFNGDGRGDLLWTNNTNDILWIWQSRGDGNYDVLTVGSYPSSWQVSGVADVNGDGRSDIVWQNPTLGLMDTWKMNGAAITGSGAKPVSSIYRIVATGDYDGDGLGDLLWTNNTNDILWVWRSRSDGNYDVLLVSGYPPTWTVVSGTSG